MHQRISSPYFSPSALRHSCFSIKFLSDYWLRFESNLSVPNLFHSTFEQAALALQHGVVFTWGQIPAEVEVVVILLRADR